MTLTEIAEKPLVFDVKDRLSKVISKMHEEKRSDAFVFNKKEFVGVISAKDIVRRGFTDPEDVKLGNLGSVIRRVKAFEANSPLKEIINSFLINNYRCVPLEGDSGMLSLNKLDLLKLVPPESLRGKKASDVMFFPECVSASDHLSVVKSIFRNSNVYRVAVIGPGSKVEGVVDDIDLLKVFTERSKAGKGEKSGEKVHEMDIPISSHLLMQGSFITASPETDLRYLVQAMIGKKNDTVVVEEDGKLAGMVTPREILKLVGSDIAGVYVNISGIQDEDSFLQNLVNSGIRSSIKKLAKIIHLHYISLNVKRRVNPTEGTKGKVSYNVKGKVVSNKGAFFADDTSWDLTKSTQSVLKKLEREVMKKMSKDRDYDKKGEEIDL